LHLRRLSRAGFDPTPIKYLNKPLKNNDIAIMNIENKWIANGQSLDAIKIVAALCMVIDHINYFYFHQSEVWMFLIGRATFPLFCYAIAVHMFRSGPETALPGALKNYGVKLLLIACLTEPISLLTRDIGTANVLFTLAAGGVLAGASFKLRDPILFLVLGLCAAFLFLPSYAEFGWAGIALPTCILALMRKKFWVWPFFILFLWAANMGDLINGLDNPDATKMQIIAFSFVVFCACSLLPVFVIQQARVLSQQGRLLPKYALHIFYPAHLLVFWVMKEFVFS
jgi:hypothetical protein